METDAIQVAVRIRPLLQHESSCRSCLCVLEPEPQVMIKGLGVQETFTYSYAFNSTKTDNDLYVSAVQPLVPRLFEGYNVTVLAYGQTGSGKTYTMGTSCGTDGGNAEGVIPRSVKQIFDIIRSSKTAKYKVSVSFLELYNEQIRDLLQNCGQPTTTAPSLEVREDATRGVCIPGLSSSVVTSLEETLQCLVKGSASRSTGSTAMNKVSSRSHAVFTLRIECLPLDGSQATVAKYCLVDLAGSERAKKTQSVGDRFKEGVNINMGLLALGNVISALGDDQQKKIHIPYRDSKLTRLLQDSLGGNSFTLMVACVSPSEGNINESLNTLRYADRALKIKNKPVINADVNTAEIVALKAQLEHCKRMLENRVKADYKQNCKPGHKRIIDFVNDYLENEPDSVFESKIHYASPKGKRQMFDAGIKLQIDEDEDDEEDDEQNGTMMMGDVRNHKHNNCLFPRIPNINSSGEDSDKDNVDEVQEEIGYKQHQEKLGSELENVERILKYKETELAQADWEQKCLELTIELNSLKKKKEQAEADIEEFKRLNNPKALGLSENRRKTIRELEQKIAHQNKLLTDHARLKQEKRRDTEKISSLSAEIHSLKQARVRLAREIKKSADNFRLWKRAQDKEVGRLQEAERKGRTKLDQQAKVFARQHNVLQRKYQEATALIKRLQGKRIASVTQQGIKNADKLETWLEHEIEVESSVVMTRDTIDQMILERSRLTDKIKEMEETKYWQDTKTKFKKIQEKKSIEKKINMHNTRIMELEEKLIGVEMCDYKSPHTRWAGVINLADARQLLNSLFVKYIDAKKELQAKDEEVEDMTQSKINLQQEINKLTLENKELKEKLTHDNEIENVLMPPPMTNNVTPTDIKKIKPVAVTSVLKNRKSLFVNFLSDDEDSEDGIVSDNSENDPDWRLTPIVKQRNSREKLGSKENVNGNTRKSKEGPCCLCKGRCSTKRCSCRKTGENCSNICKCAQAECANRPKTEDLNSTYDVLNSTPLDHKSSLKRESSDLSNIEEYEEGGAKRTRLLLK